MNRSDLGPLYDATTYRIEGPEGPIDIRVGRANPKVDALLRRVGGNDLDDWAFITAWNPRSVATPADANASAQSRLLAAVRERGLVFLEGDGIPDHPGWCVERSIWIAGITRQEAAQLGVRFGQYAVVVGTVGQAALLLYCDPQEGDTL